MATPLVVLDTMVVVGAVMGKPDSADAEVFRLVVTGEVQLAVSDDLLSELVRVIALPLR